MNNYDDTNLYAIFDAFMKYGDFYPHEIPGFPGYYINRFGIMFDKNRNEIEPYQYPNQYKMVHLTDQYGNHRVFGIHQLVAMTFDPDWFPGCIVHHIDGNKYNNNDWNLECMSRAHHTSMHNPVRYIDKIETCDICGKKFIWKASTQHYYYADIKRGVHRLKTCSPSCSSYAGRMTQLGRAY